MLQVGANGEPRKANDCWLVGRDRETILAMRFCVMSPENIFVVVFIETWRCQHRLSHLIIETLGHLSFVVSVNHDPIVDVILFAKSIARYEHVHQYAPRLVSGRDNVGGPLLSMLKVGPAFIRYFSRVG